MTATERSEQRNVILNDAFAAFMWLHEELDEIDLYMSGELGQVHSDIQEMLEGTRPMTRDEERALGELAQAWRELGKQEA